MPEISFALLESENLKTYGKLTIKQAEVIVEVTGDTDPSTLAKVREAVWEKYEPKRKNLNTALKLQRQKIEQALKAGKSQVELKKELQKKLGDAVSLLEKGMKKAIVADEALKNMVLRDGLKFGVRTTWAIGNLIWDTTEAVVSVGAAGTTLGVASLNAIRKCYAVYKDVQKILDEFANNSEEEGEHRKKLKAALKTILSIKKTAPIPSKDYTNLERLALSYPPKIAAVELSAKGLAKRLDLLLDETEKVQFPKKKQQQEVEKQINNLINKIIHINQYSKSGKELAVKAKDLLKNSKSKVATDTSYVWGLCDTLFDWMGKVDPLMEYENTVGLMVGFLNTASDQLLEAEKDLE
jgi:hypothetical protein